MICRSSGQFKTKTLWPYYQGVARHHVQHLFGHTAKQQIGKPRPPGRTQDDQVGLPLPGFLGDNRVRMSLAYLQVDLTPFQVNPYGEQF